MRERQSSKRRDGGAGAPRSRGPRERGESGRTRPASGAGAKPAPKPPASARRAIDPRQFLVRQPWDRLKPLLADAADPNAALERLKDYAALLMEWNRGVSNLISRNDEDRFVERHLAESLAPAARLRAAGPAHLVDLGSGGGLPAIPLVIAGVGERWTLVESRRNKTLFLRRVVQDLGLAKVAVLTGRLEVLVQEDPEPLRCDGFTSRATLPMGPTLELAARIVRPGGHAFLWKGSSWRGEVEADSAGAPRVEPWSLGAVEPLGDGPNVIVDLLLK